MERPDLRRLSMWEDDICFCASQCSHIDCFRHISHASRRYPFTAGDLKYTEVCPLSREYDDEEDEDDNK